MPEPLRFELACSPERAFEGFSNGSEIVRWWGDPTVYRTTSWKAEVRVGGAWRAVFETADGSRFGAAGAYISVDRPSVLVWTWTPDWDTEAKKTITMRFASSENGASMAISTEGHRSEKEAHEDEAAWTTIVGWFERHALSNQ